jgi:hypothetical protein
MHRLIMAAAIAAAPLVFALSPAAAPTINDAGVHHLGVDISAVPFTHTGVQGFLSKLSPDTRQAVESACNNYVSNGQSAGVEPQTITFCEQAVKA